MKKLLLTLFNHERYQTISIIICSLLLLAWWGCETKVKSIRDPSVKINRIQLENEVSAIIAETERKFGEMDRIDELKNYLFQQGLTAAQTGVINPLGIITGLGTILGLGAGIDNVRKRKEIKTLEKPV